MSSQTILHLFLFLHLIGLIMIAGTTLIDFVIFRQFWRQYVIDREKGIMIMQTISRLPAFMAIGGIVLILSGVGMMAVTHGIFDTFLWFRIKMVVLVFLILNIVLIGRRGRTKLRKTVITNNQEGVGENIEGLKRTVSRFQYAQLFFLFLIVLLSVFKFN